MTNPWDESIGNPVVKSNQLVYQVILWLGLVSIFISRAIRTACGFGESWGNTLDTTTQHVF